MKKIAILVSMMMVVLSTAVAAQAEVNFTLGAKAWYNSWEEKDGTDKFDFGSAFMVGPALTLRVDKFFIGGSYLMTASDYESELTVGSNTVDLSMDRQDLDLTIGYMFVPYVGIFAGYKNMTADMQVGSTASFPWKLNGPGAGVLGNVPLGESVSLYGNMACMLMNQEINDVETDGDLLGVSAEVGAAVNFVQGLAGTLGLKVQHFQNTDDSEITETFVGVTAGLSYTL